MRSFPFRRVGLPGLLLLLLTLAGRPVAATHLLGGEVRYRYIGTSTTAGRPFRYEITFSIYVNCDSLGQFGSPSNVPYGRAGIGASLYDRITGQQILDPDNPAGVVIQGRTGTVSPDPDQLVQAGLFPFARTNNPVITPPPPPGCNITAGCARLVTYTRTVDLPANTGGYYAVYSDNARNNSVTNIQDGFMTSQLLYVYMPPGALQPNSSPVFTDTTVVLVCAGTDTVTLINNAFDADGDRLTYEFYAPYGGGMGSQSLFIPPPTTVTYAAGYSLSQPFGAGGYAFINPNTGLTRYFVPNEGDYVVGVIVREHRLISGQDSVISSALREIQLKVRQCATFPPPALQVTGGQVSVAINEGDSTTFTVTASVSAGNPIRLSATSPLLDGPGGFDATFNSQQGLAANQPIVITGTSTLTGTFRFVAPPGSAGVYNVNLAVRDLQSCPVKTTAIPYIVTVHPTVPTGLPATPPPRVLLLPNPTTDGHVTLQLPSKTTTPFGESLPLTVRSVLGQVVGRYRLTIPPAASNAMLDLSGLPRGLYVVTFDSPTPDLNGAFRLMRE